MFFATFSNPTIYDVRRELVPHPQLPHMLYSHLIFWQLNYFFLILAHTVYIKRMKQEPNKLEL